MAKFNLDDYELVEDRIEKFWKDNPDGKIHTNQLVIEFSNQVGAEMRQVEMQMLDLFG